MANLGDPKDHRQQKLDEFLRFNERDVLEGAGQVRREAANQKAAAEFEKFTERRRKLAEQQGERDALQALEDAAKKLPIKRARKAKRKDDGDEV